MQECKRVILSNRQQSNQNGRRGRRQTNQDLITTCEPRFVSVDDDYVLVWVCPSGVSSPSESAQAAFCDVLFNEGVIASCQPPNGEVIESPTTPAPTPEARYEVWEEQKEELGEGGGGGEVRERRDIRCGCFKLTLNHAFH